MALVVMHAREPTGRSCEGPILRGCAPRSRPVAQRHRLLELLELLPGATGEDVDRVGVTTQERLDELLRHLGPDVRRHWRNVRVDAHLEYAGLVARERRIPRRADVVVAI